MEVKNKPIKQSTPNWIKTFSNESFNEKIYLEKIMLSTLILPIDERFVIRRVLLKIYYDLFTNVRPHEIIESKVYCFSIS